MISGFVKYAGGLIFLGLSFAVLAGTGTSLQPYDNKIFSENPAPNGNGFYFSMEGSKKYPNSCEDFYQLWEAKKNVLDVDVPDSQNTYYRYHLGGCLLSKWTDFSKINVKDNIINQTGIKKITSILPAGIAAYISLDQCEKVVIAEKQHRTLHDVAPDLKPTKKQNDEVDFKYSGGEDFSIEFYGAVPDKYFGKVYPINTSYSVRAGTGGTYNTSHSYLLSKDDSGNLFIVHRFPELGPCH
nr:hypothetical protein 49p1_00164 [Yersinia frederiksenii]